MSNNLPQKYNNNIFRKIFNKIKRIFFKEKTYDNTIKEEIEQKENHKTLKVENNLKNKEEEKKKVIEQITSNREMLESLSNDKLKIILKYYLEDNKKKKEMINNLKKGA